MNPDFIRVGGGGQITDDLFGNKKKISRYAFPDEKIGLCKSSDIALAAEVYSCP